VLMPLALFPCILISLCLLYVCYASLLFAKLLCVILYVLMYLYLLYSIVSLLIRCPCFLEEIFLLFLCAYIRGNLLEKDISGVFEGIVYLYCKNPSLSCGVAKDGKLTCLVLLNVSFALYRYLEKRRW